MKYLFVKKLLKFYLNRILSIENMIAFQRAKNLVTCSLPVVLEIFFFTMVGVGCPLTRAKDFAIASIFKERLCWFCRFITFEFEYLFIGRGVLGSDSDYEQVRNTHPLSTLRYIVAKQSFSQNCVHIINLCSDFLC